MWVCAYVCMGVWMCGQTCGWVRVSLSGCLCRRVKLLRKHTQLCTHRNSDKSVLFIRHTYRRPWNGHKRAIYALYLLSVYVKLSGYNDTEDKSRSKESKDNKYSEDNKHKIK